MKNASDIRISQSAKIKMSEQLEEYACGLAEKSARYARHARRKTVIAEDIELAQKDSI